MTNVSDDARKTADRVVRRERRRIRLLAVLTIGLWVLAALLIPSVYLPLGAKVKHYAQIIKDDNPAAASILMRDDARRAPPTPPTPEELPGAVATLQQHQWIITQIIFHEWLIGAIILAFALGAAILASASTVALALTIRRVTLRQVSASLAEISDQLRLLREQRGRPS